MALDIEAQDKPYSAAGARPLPQSNLWPALRRLFMPLASLKLTVALFAAAIFLVFAGTLAQKEVDVWDVIEYWFHIDERNLISPEFPYFHPSELFVRIPLRIFCIDLLWPSFIGTPHAFPGCRLLRMIQVLLLMRWAAHRESIRPVSRERALMMPGITRNFWKCCVMCQRTNALRNFIVCWSVCAMQRILCQ